jgi:GTPase SAR1 family protein
MLTLTLSASRRLSRRPALRPSRISLGSRASRTWWVDVHPVFAPLKLLRDQLRKSWVKVRQTLALLHQHYEEIAAMGTLAPLLDSMHAVPLDAAYRVIVLGPGRAGKSTLIKALSQELSSSVDSRDHVNDPTGFLKMIRGDGVKQTLVGAGVRFEEHSLDVFGRSVAQVKICNALRACSYADAVLMVLDSNTLDTEDLNYSPIGLEQIGAARRYVVINRMYGRDIRRQIKEDLSKKLRSAYAGASGKPSVQEMEFYHVDALEAHRGRLHNDSEGLRSSGIQDLAQAVMQILASERSPVYLRYVAARAVDQIRLAESLIGGQEALLQMLSAGARFQFHGREKELVEMESSRMVIRAKFEGCRRAAAIILTTNFDRLIESVVNDMHGELTRAAPRARRYADRSMTTSGLYAPGLHKVERLIAAEVAALATAYVRQRFTAKKVSLAQRQSRGMKNKEAAPFETLAVELQHKVCAAEAHLILYRLQGNLGPGELVPEGQWWGQVTFPAVSEALGLDAAVSYRSEGYTSLGQTLYYVSGLHSALVALLGDSTDAEELLFASLIEEAESGLTEDKTRSELIRRVAEGIARGLPELKKKFRQRLQDTLDILIRPFESAFMAFYEELLAERVSTPDALQSLCDLDLDRRADLISASRESRSFLSQERGALIDALSLSLSAPVQPSSRRDMRVDTA